MAVGSFDYRRSSLGEILVNIGVITDVQLQDALRECQDDQKRLGPALVKLGFATEEKILKALSLRLDVAHFTTFDGLLDPAAGSLIPESLARKHLAVPVRKAGGVLTVGMINPVDINAIDEISAQTGLRVVPIMTSYANLFEAIDRVYRDGAAAAPTTQEAAPAEKTEAPAAEAPRDDSAVALAEGLLREGMARKASDIHLEPTENALRVRYRVDGMMQEGKALGKDIEQAVIARMKILSKLDITESRLPQDGHLRLVHEGRGVDVRVSTLPTVYGEKVVLRILDSSRAVHTLDELGLEPGARKSFSAAIRRPTGMILVTGPTGSGKTSTLYAAVAELNDAKRNIVTLEDPVEVRIAGINQVETHAKIGLTFAAGLRSILRQDPNIILVGEIRDVETAEIAVQAAITGHLVFSTLHTNDAVSAVHRLLNMRTEPFLVAAALTGVMAQRLVRRLCEKCKRAHAPTPGELEALGGDLVAGTPCFESAGCEACFNTGYSGRAAVHEWLELNQTLRELILRRASVDELTAAARAAGMRTLRQDALLKASRGLTSLAEVVRVTSEAGQPDAPQAG